MCRVNHAEVMKFKGRLTEAQELADSAGQELRVWNPRIAGAAFYELGEVRLRLGELAQAEQAFREADELGRTPEPGLSLLRLVQGNAKGALASIRRAVGNDSLSLPAQARLLPAAVEIAVAAGEPDEAAGYAERFAPLAETYDTSALHATAAFTSGQVALARGDADGAYQAFRQARTTWESNGATYDVARAREQLGRALRMSGDEEAAVWELQAAAARFERLGAARDADRVAELLMRDTSTEVMKTFLFTDIVGSTEIASAAGSDRHWVNLLRRHDDALRAIFADFKGQVVDHTGRRLLRRLRGGRGRRRRGRHDPAGDRPGLRVRHPHRRPHATARCRRGRTTTGRASTPPPASAPPRRAGRSWPARRRSGSCAQFAVTSPRSLTLKGFKDPVDVCSVEWAAAE